MKKWLTRVLVVGAGLYPVTLAVIVLLFRIVAERWWVTGVGIYLPRFGFLLPIPFFVAALIACGRPRVLWTQVIAAAVGLFPLMGLVLPWSTGSKEGAPTLRIFSFNVNSIGGGLDNLLGAIAEASPDVVLLQEVIADPVPLVAALKERYIAVESSTQFVIASRFPILSTLDPDRISIGERQRSPRFLRHLLSTPLGRLAVYNVHPVSPRWGFYKLRGEGLRKEILSGRLFTAANVAALQEDSELRTQQIEAFSALSDAETDSVVIAGDTNTPSGSRVLFARLSRYQDGFVEAGRGFGYTYPSRLPWMRIDRILTSPDLRFVRFSVDCGSVSDHQCVVADVQRRAP
jgi:vancomycin resistance protein VanJ